MTHIKRLVLVLSWAFLYTSYSNAQQAYSSTESYSTTGNIVIPTTDTSGSTWTGAVFQNNLTCWAWGDPGYCGPQPIVRPGDNINFSYGSSYIFQQQGVAGLLPNNGTGLVVNGYNFSFTAKNGNGWDDGRTDNLYALVRFWDKTGGRSSSNLLYGNVYDLNYSYNWTTFNFSETFNKALPVPELGQVQYGFIGSDNNGWTGPYGPEVYGVKFSLKYSVDPCSTNTFYSTTCAGYFEALAKLAPTASVTTADYSPPPPPPPDAPPPPPPGLPPPPPGSSGPPPPPGASPPPGSGPTPVATTTTTAATSEKSQAAGPGLGFALNLIAKNSEREKAIAQQVVAASIMEAQAASDKATAVAATTAAAAAVGTTSTDSQFGGGGIQATNSIARAASGLGLAIQAVGITQLQATQSVSTSAATTQATQQQQLLQPTLEVLQGTQSTGILEVQVSRVQEQDTPPQSLVAITDRGNPLRDIIMPPAQRAAPQPEQPGTVNRAAQPNEVAGGVLLERMATMPQGYGDYTNLVLPDAKFYSAKPIYANQRVVDNARVLRGLGSDQKHQELVNLQYK